MNNELPTVKWTSILKKIRWNDEKTSVLQDVSDYNEEERQKTIIQFKEQRKEELKMLKQEIKELKKEKSA